jgi:prevent-host-death family protein
MKTIQANLHEAKTNLSRLVANALAGDEVIIAKAGVPKVKLVPLPPPGTGKLGVLKGQFVVPDSFFEPMTEEELGEWE